MRSAIRGLKSTATITWSLRDPVSWPSVGVSRPTLKQFRLERNRGDAYAADVANTYTALHYHVIFSTKNREPWIRQELESRVWPYLGGIARENGVKALLIGGIENHVHLLLGIPPVLAVSKSVQLIKGGSSKWIKEALPGLGGFGWQDGYAAFTVSKSHLLELEAYIRNQREHHRHKSFEEEYRAFLDRHDIQYDERYVFEAEIVG